MAQPSVHPHTAVRDPEVGDVVDRRYVLKREIARGGMGAVFEAEQIHMKRPVAVKLLLAGYMHRDDIRKRLLREARALALTKHPNIVEVHDAGICDRAGVFLVLEMLEGRTLDGILASRARLPINDAVHVGRQLLEALAFAHARGVIHRDVKPSNVFIARNELGEEVVKLLDFGICQAAERHSTASELTKITRAGELLGTFDYMAPEQLLARDCVDHRADLYSAGVTLYECLTGEVPYTGNYQSIVLKLLGRKDMPSVRRHRLDVPEEIARVIERALVEEPSERYADAISFADAIVGASGLDFGRSTLLGPAPHRPGVRIPSRLSELRGLRPQTTASASHDTQLVDPLRTLTPERAAQPTLAISEEDERPKTPHPSDVTIAGTFLSDMHDILEPIREPRVPSLRSADTVDPQIFAGSERKIPTLEPIVLQEPVRVDSLRVRQEAVAATKRKHARSPYVTPVRVLRDHFPTVEGRCEDISEGGVLIVCDQLLHDTERVRVRFALPMTGSIVTISANVRWIRSHRGRTAIGLEFSDLRPSEAHAIASYVSLMQSIR